jgi:hypothetical protein
MATRPHDRFRRRPRPTPKAVSRERGGSPGGVLATYRKSVMGMAGLVILVVFVAMAVPRPVLVSSTGLDVTKVNGHRSRRRPGPTRSGPTTRAARS